MNTHGTHRTYMLMSASWLRSNSMVCTIRDGGKNVAVCCSTETIWKRVADKLMHLMGHRSLQSNIGEWQTTVVKRGQNQYSRQELVRRQRQHETLLSWRKWYISKNGYVLFISFKLWSFCPLNEGMRWGKLSKMMMALPLMAWCMSSNGEMSTRS